MLCMCHMVRRCAASAANRSIRACSPIALRCSWREVNSNRTKLAIVAVHCVCNESYSAFAIDAISSRADLCATSLRHRAVKEAVNRAFDPSRKILARTLDLKHIDSLIQSSSASASASATVSFHSFNPLGMSVDPTLERSFRGHVGAVNSVCFNASCTQLASGGSDHSVIIWNFKPNLRSFKYRGHTAAVQCVAFSPDGGSLASSGADSTIRLWQPTVRGASRCVRSAHAGCVRSVQWSADGSLLVTAGDDKCIKLWHAHSLRFVASFTGHTNWVRHAALSPDARLIVSASDDGTVRLWDVASRSCLHVYHEHSTSPSIVSVRHCAFHPSGTLIASCASDGSIHVSDVRTHELLQHYAAHSSTESHAACSQLAFHASGNFMLSVGDDALVKVWDLTQGVQLYTVHAHRAPAMAIAFAHDGKWFASAGADSRVLVWRTNFDSHDAQADADADAASLNQDVQRDRRAASPTKKQHDRVNERVDSPDLTHPTQHAQLDTTYDCNYSHAHVNMAKQTSHRFHSGDSQEAPLPPPAREQALTPPPPPPAAATGDEAARTARGTSSKDIEASFARHAFAHNRSSQEEDRAFAQQERQAAADARVQTKAHQHTQHSHQPPSLSQSRGVGLMSSAETPVALPPELAQTLRQIVSQLDLVTQTLAVLDDRLVSHESRVQQMSDKHTAKERQAFREDFLAQTSKQPIKY